jgi:hypothetical protein
MVDRISSSPCRGFVCEERRKPDGLLRRKVAEAGGDAIGVRTHAETLVDL